jgi:hypothetical protein
MKGFRFRAKGEEGGTYDNTMQDAIDWTIGAEQDVDEPDVIRNLNELSQMDFEPDIKGYIAEAYMIHNQRKLGKN